MERGKERRNTPKAAAYREHPSDQTSVLAVMVQLEGTSNSSGALGIVQSTQSPLAYHSLLDCGVLIPILCCTCLCTQLLESKGLLSAKENVVITGGCTYTHTRTCW